MAYHTLSAALCIYTKWRQPGDHSLPLSWNQYSNDVEFRYDLKELQLVILLFSGASGNSNMNTCNELSPGPKPQLDCTVTSTFLDGLWKTSSSPGSTSFRTCSRLHGFTLVYPWLNCERYLTFSLDLCWRLQTEWSCKLLDCYNRRLCLLPAIHDGQQWLNHHGKHFCR